ncbi:hypothetical protein BAZSYMB_GCONTIG00653_4 [Bathymodiolus azoricus thioautotrophic gill symbiont]|uniref:Uncharacterized protein n=1 Tax=Bathymodiolus azoricus thioautotrophic gill symbiont TaxID=235205 RepID=A0A1H6M496_9GAMM|nr:hypothetical protein BAZSYMB_GCONTIG00653_4 [Bathymodiolus azoricus thioautotrophic gill symbiont]
MHSPVTTLFIHLYKCGIFRMFACYVCRTFYYICSIF